MDKSKLNQSEMKYSCGAGNASVNLYSGRVLFEHPDISIGANSFEIGVSHIYSSTFDETRDLLHIESFYVDNPDYFRTGMGKGWKLNVQQYLFSYMPNLHIEGFEGFESGDIVYIDGGGNRHRFVFYKRPDMGKNAYYDTSGLGLTLVVTNAAGSVYEWYIEDDMGNRIYFDTTGKIERTVAAVNKKIIKRYEYNSDGLIQKIWDERKKDRYLSFEYSGGGLLQTVTAVENGVEHKKINYYYSEDKLMITSVTAKTGESKDLAAFDYNEIGSLISAVEVQDKSALRIEYESVSKINVYSGIANLQAHYIKNNFCGNAMSGSETVCIGSHAVKYSVTQFFEKSKDMISANRSFASGAVYETKVRNHKDITVVYNFNSKGFTTSCFQNSYIRPDKTTILDNYRSLFVEKGIPLLEDKYIGDMYINGRLVHNVTDDLYLTSDVENFDDVFYQLKEVAKYKANENFALSFWMKNTACTDKVALTVVVEERKKDESGNPILTTLKSNALVDATAPYSWQYVVIPIQIGRDYIDNGRVKAVTLGLHNTVISNILVSQSQAPRMMLTDGDNPDYLSNIATFVIDGKQQAINADNFVSESDIQKTYYNYYKRDSEKFDFVYCDGTKRKSIKHIGIISLVDQYYDIGLYSKDKFNPLYFYESKSPDNNIYTYSSVSYLENERLAPGYTVNKCIKLTNSAYKYVGGTGGISFSYTWTDHFGNTLKTMDAYGVQEVYYYDSYGNPIKTERRADGESEVITTYFSYDYIGENVDGISDAQKDISFKYNSPQKTLKNVSEAYSFLTEYEYDAFGNKTDKATAFKSYNQRIQLSQNSLFYNDRGLLNRVKDSAGNDYCIDYDNFGDPEEFYYYSVSNIKKTILKKTQQREMGGGSIVTETYGNGGSQITSFDEYGRISRISENGEVKAMFDYQSLNESSICAKLTKIKDYYDNRRYEYFYTSDNELSSYTVTEIGSDRLITKIEAITDGFGHTLWTPIVTERSTYYSDSVDGGEILINPRINRTTGNHIITEYQFDKLGRPSKIDCNFFAEEYTYIRGTELVERIKYNSKNDISEPKKLNCTTNYKYNNGKITNREQISQNVSSTNDESTNGEQIWRYVDSTYYSYNTKNQLTKEIRKLTNTKGDIVSDKAIDYIYDDNGNLDIIRENGSNSKTFSYDDYGRIHTFSDNGGYCMQYFDGYGNVSKREYNRTNIVLEWTRGNLMTRYGNNRYSYNSRRLRWKKQTADNEHIYYYDGDKLIGEKNVFERLGFMYDRDGMYGIDFDGTLFYLSKDADGSVTKLFSASGILMAQYRYDAFGNCTVYDGNWNPLPFNDKEHIGTRNPIRWKGYYYEIETGLFYTPGRYYDPEVGRWINADDISYLDPETIGGLNLYAYSLNNPVMYYDPTGNFAISIFLICLGIGLVAGAALGGYTAVQSGAELWSKDFWIGVGTGALIGGAVGAVAGLGGAFLAGGLSSLAGKFVADAASSLMFGTNNFGTWEDYAIAFVMGGLLKGLPLGKLGSIGKGVAKFAGDVALRPALNQFAKMGTRGAEFDLNNYLYTVVIRAATFNIGFGNVKFGMLGSEFSLSLGKSIMRGFLSGFRKKYMR